MYLYLYETTCTDLIYGVSENIDAIWLIMGGL